jgi:hypothetical protein
MSPKKYGEKAAGNFLASVLLCWLKNMLGEIQSK